METRTAQDLLSSLIDKAKANGADAADAVLFNSVSHGVSWRLGKLEDVERSEGVDLGVRMIFGKRSASVSTNDLSKASLEALSERCAAMAKAAPEDPYVGLAPKERLAKAPHPELDLGDFADPGSDVLKERAAACEEAALAVKGVVNSSGAGASYGEGRKWLITSDGFFGESGGSSHSISVSVLAEDANGMERDYDYDSKTHADDLRDVTAIGRRAGEWAVSRLSPEKVKSQKAAVLFDNRVSASLLGHLAGAINGAAIARGVSFLKNRMGERLFSPDVTIVDDPFIPRGHGSRPFDGEGVRPAPLSVIADGVLTTWILNSAQARQLDLETNGRATRGTGGSPGAATTNLYLKAGVIARADLIAGVTKGLLVTDMFGPQVNSNTGDYSVGCSGMWIENGAPTVPVSEITIAGNLLDMYARLVAADDLEFRSSTNAPTVSVGEMTIAGN
ncbi:MAG: TldD/PmbA family protein [Alphaproteobacteria bacterium]|nr:TldD/PmbA family protein [Alphaproteobacteria bacterium]